MNLQETYKLRYQDADFKGRVIAAIAKFAQDVESEDPTTPNHANRLNYAQMWLAQVEGTADNIMWAVVAQAPIQASGTATSDADIQGVVNGILIAQVPHAPA
jgi:hypothetical protein